jgi:hypothetical protein
MSFHPRYESFGLHTHTHTHTHTHILPFDVYANFYLIESALICSQGLRNPFQIEVTVQYKKGQDQMMPTTLENMYCFVPAEDKLHALMEFLKSKPTHKVFVFMLTCACVEYYLKASTCSHVIIFYFLLIFLLLVFLSLFFFLIRCDFLCFVLVPSLVCSCSCSCPCSCSCYLYSILIILFSLLKPGSSAAKGCHRPHNSRHAW